MNKLLSAAGLALVLAAPGFAQDGFYIKGGVGYGSPGVIDGDRDAVPQDFDLDPEADLRLMVGGGYGFANGLRLDVDLVDRFNDAGALGDMPPGDGDYQNLAVGVNVLYDFFRGSTMQPYVGGGLVLSRLDYSGQFVSGGMFEQIDESSSRIGVQGLAGFALKLNDRWLADIGYRYFNHGDELKFQALGQNVELEEYHSHDVMFGLRYSFAQPAPAPEPAPAPPPAPIPAAPAAPVVEAGPICENVPFVVYFEWDSSELSAQAQNVIGDAAERVQDCEVTLVAVEGHTDTSGNPAYNERLSQRRAGIVRDELIQAGVAASLITVEARGEGALAKATPDGVREPLNRRSQVLITVEGGPAS